MRNHNILIFLAAYLLFIAAHAGFAGTPAAVPQMSEPEKPVYCLEPVSTARSAYSKDGKNVKLAECDYQLLTLTASNLETLSSGEAETAERNMAAFNERMEQLRDELRSQGQDVSGYAEDDYAQGFLVSGYYDSVVTSGSVVGDIVSIRIDRSSYTGGAHPNSYVSGYLFDLESGQFILASSQLADDPASFQLRAGAILVEKAEKVKGAAWGYWDDYQDIILSGSSGVTVLDETGMTVVYAPYELGCYAIGEIELHLDWEELADLLGPGGLAKLGVQLPETAE